MVRIEASISLHKSNKIYNQNDSVEGTIHVKINKKISAKGLKIKITGKGRTDFDVPCTPVLSGRESYFNKSVFVFGSEAGPAIPLSEGNHKFDFAIQLDSSVPSSMRGRNFSNKYVLTMQWIGLDLTSSFMSYLSPKPEVQFQVIRHEDLNDRPLLNDPVEEEISHPLSVKVKLPKAGFTPGENIPIGITITNEFSKDVQLVEAKLKTVFELSHNKKGEYDQSQPSIIARVTSGGVKRGETEQFTVDLRVPNDVISSSTVPSNIMLRYELEVTAQTECFSRKQCINIPITIGSVALKQA